MLDKKKFFRKICRFPLDGQRRGNSYCLSVNNLCVSKVETNKVSLLIILLLSMQTVLINPEITLLGIHTEETRIERDTCTPMFIAALFTIARTWKQPRRPSTDELIRKLWYIYSMEYYSAIKKNAFESVLMRYMKLETIIESEVSQKEKHQYSILTHIYGT